MPLSGFINRAKYPKYLHFLSPCTPQRPKPCQKAQLEAHYSIVWELLPQHARAVAEWIVILPMLVIHQAFPLKHFERITSGSFLLLQTGPPKASADDVWKHDMFAKENQIEGGELGARLAVPEKAGSGSSAGLSTSLSLQKALGTVTGTYSGKDL